MILKKYKISVDEYNKLYEQQKGFCDICGVHQTELKRRLAVDHCHKTGKFRAWLCNKCNTGFAQLGDSAESLERAAKFLKERENLNTT